MKRRLLVLLALLAVAVYAQQQAGRDDEPGAEGASPTEQAAEPGDADGEQDEPGADPEGSAPGADEGEAGGDGATLRDPGDAAEGEGANAEPAAEDFDPEEEISEDYPVPLPSDI